MSEKEKEKQIENKETGETPKGDLLDVSMAQTIAERDSAVEELEKALDRIDKLEKKLADAESLITEDTKAGLIKDIAPRVEIPKSVLAMKTVDELMQMKKTLDISKYSFKSSNPVKIEEDSPEHKLRTRFDRYMQEKYGGNR